MATQSNPAYQTYDPNAAQPLDSGSAAGDDSAAAAGPALPPITAPPQAKSQPTDTTGADAGSGPKLLPGAKGTKMGVAAYLIESLLKGVQKGRDQSQQVQAYQAKRLSDGLQYAYQTTADNYTSLIKSGADPNSPEVQKADIAQRAAYQSLMQMRGNYIMGQDGKSKKKKGQDDQQDPMQMVMSSDPQTKMKGAYLLQQKMFQNIGTPANANARQYLTPEYQAQRKLMSSQQTLSQGNVEDKLQLRNLEMADTSKMTPEQKSAHEQQTQALRDRIGEVSTGYSQKEKIIDKKTTPDNHQWVLLQDATGHTRWEDQGEQRGLASTIAKPGSEQEYIERVAKEAGVAEKDLSADSLLKLRQSFAASNQMGKVVSRNYVYTDKETGQIIVVPLTSTTTPVGEGKGVPQVHASGTPAPASASASTSHQSSTGGSASINPAGTTASSDQLPAGSPKGAHVIGQTLSQPKAKVQASTTDEYKKMKPLFGLLGAQEDYMKQIEADPSKATPRQDLSLVVASVRAMNPGSVRLPQKELELEIKAGSYGDRAKRWYDNATTGLLPDDQRKDLFGIVQRETTKSGESIAADWQQNMSGQPLPNDLKRFAKNPGTDSTGGNTGGGAANAPIHPDLKNKMDADFGAPKS